MVSVQPLPDSVDISHKTEPSERINITSPAFGREELDRLQSCLQSGWVAQGPYTQQFEKLFRDRHSVTNAVATTSCTAALHMAAMALGIGPGDEVIVPAFTWVTSAHCAEYVGARVAFADVDPSTFNIDPNAVKAAIGPTTKAIVVVHLFGLAAPMDQLLEIAQNHKLAIIEDAACAVGTTYHGRPVGGFGDVGCFSFHPRKIITTGEGGMAATNSNELAQQLRILRNHGASGHPDFSNGKAKPYTMGRFNHLGFNLRLSDIQAAVGVAQFGRLDTLLSERGNRANRYLHLMSCIDEIELPRAPAGCGHTYQSFVIRLVDGDRTRRNAIMEFLDQHGIQTRPGTHAVHRLGYYADKYSIAPDQFPNAAAAEDLTITLPLFPGMTDAQQDYIVGKLQAALAMRISS